MELLPFCFILLTSQLQHGVCSCDLKTVNVDILPRSPFRYHGEALDMICQVHAKPHHTVESGTDVRMILANKTEVDTTISIRNATTIIRNSTSDVINPVERKVSDILYFCVVSSPQCDSLQTSPLENFTFVAVDNYPKPVHSVSCIISNCQAITCIFDLGQFYRHSPNGNPRNSDEGMSMDIDMKNASRDHPTKSNWARCSHLSYTDDEVRDAVTCTWHEQEFRSGIYEFKVNITNKFRKDSVFSNLHTMVFVKPDAVTNILVRKLNSTAVTMEWNHTLCCPVAYIVNVLPWSNACGPTTPQNVSTNITSVTISGLRPFNKYTFSITAHQATQGISEQHHSDPTSINLTTLADVPQANPNMHPGSFYMDSNTSRTQLSWNPINICQQNGPGFRYKATIRYENGTDLMVFSEGFSTSLPTDSNDTYTIYLQACNAIGCVRDQPRYTTISNKRPEKPATVTVDAINNTSVLISWTRDNLSNALASTVHYCRTAGKHACLSSVTNRTTYPNESSLNVVLPGHYKQYLFGVSFEAESNEEQIFSSGIRWATCTRFMYGVPRTFMETSVNYTDAGVLLVWVPYPECNPDYGVAKYAIITIMNEKMHNTTMNLTMSSKAYLLSDLQAGRYSWWIQGDFPGDLSRPSPGIPFVIHGNPNYLPYVLIILAFVLAVVAVILLMCCTKLRTYCHKVETEMAQIQTPFVFSDGPDSGIGAEEPMIPTPGTNNNSKDALQDSGNSNSGSNIRDEIELETLLPIPGGRSDKPTLAHDYSKVDLHHSENLNTGSKELVSLRKQALGCPDSAGPSGMLDGPARPNPDDQDNAYMSETQRLNLNERGGNISEEPRLTLNNVANNFASNLRNDYVSEKQMSRYKDSANQLSENTVPGLENVSEDSELTRAYKDDTQGSNASDMNHQTVKSDYVTVGK